MKKVVFSALFVSVLALGAFASVDGGDKPCKGKKNKKSCCQSKEANNTSSGNTQGCCQNKSK